MNRIKQNFFMSLRDRIPQEHLTELNNLPTQEPAVNIAREDAEYETIRVLKHCIPRNARLVEAYECGGVLLLMGNVAPNDEEHNCDAMGCGSMSHVIYRTVLPHPYGPLRNPENRQDLHD